MLQIELRRNHNQEKSERTHTILVERIPDTLASKKALRRYFEAAIGEVLSVDIVPADSVVAKLRRSVEERDLVLERLERARFEDAKKREKLSKSGSKSEAKSTHVVVLKKDGSENECLTSRACCYGYCCLSCCGHKVESAAHYESRLKELNSIIPDLQRQAAEDISERDRSYSGYMQGGKGHSPSDKFDFPSTNTKLYSADSAVRNYRHFNFVLCFQPDS